jgi:hypothetical protein
MKNRFSGLTAAKVLQQNSGATEPQEIIRMVVDTTELLEEQGVRRRGRPSGKRSNPAFRQVTAYISSEAYKRTKMKLLEQDNRQEFSELIDTLLAKWLEE